MSINNKIKEFFSSVIKLQSKKVVSKDNPYKYNKKSEVCLRPFTFPALSLISNITYLG